LTGQLLTDRAPSAELFIGTLGLSVLLVIRLLITFGENGWLLRRLETSGHAEERLRDLGLALNLQASREMERVLELVCREGRAALLRSQGVLAGLLLRHRETIGAIVCGSTRLPEASEERDISRAELLAAQAMVAMENARLYGEAKGQLEETTALYEIASAARD